MRPKALAGPQETRARRGDPQTGLDALPKEVAIVLSLTTATILRIPHCPGDGAAAHSEGNTARYDVEIRVTK